MTGGLDLGGHGGGGEENVRWTIEWVWRREEKLSQAEEAESRLASFNLKVEIETPTPPSSTCITLRERAPTESGSI